MASRELGEPTERGGPTGLRWVQSEQAGSKGFDESKEIVRPRWNSVDSRGLDELNGIW